MADLAEALALTLDNEGHYGGDPWGGETYRGIARVYHPDWPGWMEIDPVVARCEGDVGKINAALRKMHHLNAEVANFYAREFWAPLNLASISRQTVANKIFDIAVMSGHRRAGRTFQHALNALNANQKYYRDIAVDGKIGPKTIVALESCLQSGRRAEDINELMHVIFGHFLYEQTQRIPEKETVLLGWIRRSRRVI